MDITGKLVQVNKRLKRAKTGVAIEQHGNWLKLRATLPPKPGSSKQRPWQQRIAIKAPANPVGLKAAEIEAKLLGGLLAAKEFSWSRYTDQKSDDRKLASVVVEEFRQHYIATGGKENTWANEYAKVFKNFPPDAYLSPDSLKSLITRTKPNTRTRLKTCVATGCLVKFVGIEFNVKPYRGNYSPSKVKPRDLPDDKTIAAYQERLSHNKGWQWVYGMMATYGLRNHECFFVDLEDFPIVRVLERTKTGSRQVWPCYPEWCDQWELKKRTVPPISLNRTNDRIGQAVTDYLSPKLPFKPYDLRHAWAVRTLEFGWPDALSAQQMGHSLEIHNRTYQRWITLRHHQRIYELLVNRDDRPRPPTL